MKKLVEHSNITALLANIFLMIIKFIGGIFSGSIALLSDALNSLTDVLASLALLISVKVSHKHADINHPFGHHRAEPLGALIVAIIAGILGFEVIRKSFTSLFVQYQITLNPWIYGIVIITILLKGILHIVFKKFSKKNHAPSLKALAIDSINDVAVSSLVLLNFILYINNIKYVDSIVGVFIGCWIIYNGYDIARDNIGYLMGSTPNKNTMTLIKNKATSIEKVKGIHDIRAHYVGTKVHVEIHIDVDKKISLEKAHSLSKQVQNKVEALDVIDRAFIHIDPR